MPSLQEPSGLDLQSLDGPEGSRVDGGYGLVTEVTEVFGMDTEDMEGIWRIHKSGTGDGDYGGLSNDVVNCRVRGYISLYKMITN